MKRASPIGCAPISCAPTPARCTGPPTSASSSAQGLGFNGDLGRCRGWVERTGRLLTSAGIDCVEQGYLEYGLGMLRLFEAGDIAGAHAHFTQAGKIGARFTHHELITLARIGEGRMLIYLGDISEGMALLDEAMVSIEAAELSPLATGDAYCTVIDACAELFDVGRCRAWTESLTRWCDTQQELVLYRGHCFLHRAEVLGQLGAWPEALIEARRACDRLAAPVNPSRSPARVSSRATSSGWPASSTTPKRRTSGPASSAATRSLDLRCCVSPRGASTPPTP